MSEMTKAKLLKENETLKDKVNHLREIITTLKANIENAKKVLG